MRQLPKYTAVLLLVASMLGCAECSGPKSSFRLVIRHDGEVSTRHVPVSSFSTVVVDGPVNVDVRPGSSPAVEVRTDESAQDKVHVAVREGVLTVQFEDDVARLSADSKVTVTTPTLDAVTLKGMGDVDVAPRPESVRQLSLTQSGSGKLQWRGGSAEKVVIVSTDSGAVHLSGRARTVSLVMEGMGDVTLGGGLAERLDASVEGSGTLDARGMPARELRVSTHGFGNARVTAAGGPVELSTHGSGDIEWWGEAGNLQSSKSGFGDITHHRAHAGR